MKLNKEELLGRLEAASYIADSQLVTALLLMEQLGRPLLLEGEAGVGKTEVAKAVAKVTKRPLIRLQCHEGLDIHSAVYEWNYQRQILAIRIAESEGGSAAERERHIFQEEYLLRRPILRAIDSPEPVVLLIDEIDRADEEFEAYLLEVLSDFQVTVPELGTIVARSRPGVFLTSNGTRELSDALRRRCLYQYLDYPSEDRELRIVMARVPGISLHLAAQVTRFVQALRTEDLKKRPGVAETLDWAAAVVGLDLRELGDDPDLAADTLICLLKTREDQAAMAPEVVRRMLARVA